MEFDRVGGFYSGPFPSDDLLRADGTIDLAGFPNPGGASLIASALSLASTTGGFAVSAGSFFQTSAAVDPSSLPTLAESAQSGASAFLVDIDASSPGYLTRQVAHVSFTATSSPFGAPNLLALVPLQGLPLRPKTAYAAVVTTAVKDLSGAQVLAAPSVTALAAGQVPEGLSSSAIPVYSAALTALAKMGIAPSSVAGLSAFTTGDPLAQTSVFRDDVLSRPLPTPDSTFQQTDLFDEYCAYESTIPMPDYQSGTPPFTSTGGNWLVDASGKPILQRMEEARIFVTVPRAPIPDSGVPIALFIRTGAGGDRPLIDRGTQATNGGPPIVPGSGPALFFARAGFAGASVDGPLGGIRNTTNANEDFTVFNVFNPPALRDNVRQSALELMLQAHILPTISFDVSDCPGAVTASGSTVVHFDVTHLAIMGHSMGATIAPLSVALEPSFKSVVLSGAGSSWIENVLYKQLPLEVAPALEFLLSYDVGSGQVMTEYDPALSLFQWAIESADPQVYDSSILTSPRSGAAARQVLMFQGIVDHYILPDIANATTLSLGLDLGGVELDQSSSEPSGQTLVSSVLPFAGKSTISLPASGNLTGGDGTTVTGVLVQAPGDAIEDGHEVVFQTDGPKHQYQCFLTSTLAGVATVPPPASVDAGCGE
jgi:hypothetical protein